MENKKNESCRNERAKNRLCEIRLISYSFGMIDFLHYGHIQALLQAKNSSDLHIFGLVGEETVRSWMGSTVSSYEERVCVLSHIDCVDKILYQDNFDPTNNLKRIHDEYPQATITLYHGDDWKILPAETYLRSIGGSVVFTKYNEKFRPERIMDRLSSNAKTIARSAMVSTKANTLKALQSFLHKSKIEDIYIVLYASYKVDPVFICREIGEYFSGKKIVVRSSSVNEDCYEKSNAGCFDSILNVDSTNIDEVESAIKTVFDSYGMGFDPKKDDNEQVLIQAQSLNIKKSGVVLTRDMSGNRPYYLINYDISGATDSVTGGQGGDVVWISRELSVRDVSPTWRGLIEAIKEIEEVLKDMVLDIEFAIDSYANIIIFQVRPLAAMRRFNKRFNDRVFYQLQQAAKKKYQTIIKDVEFDTLQLSDMAFWNPAEIIGARPHNLDYSLYREIITKRTWNEGISRMGYKAVHKELMCRIADKPYIILEHAFRSLIPEVLSHHLTNKLITYYIDCLKSDVSAHDKIEFEIVLSCFDFLTEERLQEMRISHNFTENETEQIKDALFSLTEKIINTYDAILVSDKLSLRELDKMSKKIEAGLTDKCSDTSALIGYFRDLLKWIRIKGTPMFSGQARCAFISKALCMTMVRKNYFSEEEMGLFLSSVHTIASDFENDYDLLVNGNISRHDFNKKYGHLRSGTYDIRTLRYEQIDFVNIGSVSHFSSRGKKEMANGGRGLEVGQLQRALTDIGFHVETVVFGDFLRESLEQREWFKFEFTKALSLAIEILVMIGENLGIDRAEMSYLEISDIMAAEHYGIGVELRGFFKTLISQRRLQYKQNTQLILPSVISSEDDITEISVTDARPNFITLKQIEAELIVLDGRNITDIEGKIVVLEKADPGYDWIFTRNIKGLITKYGGVASHMAIRCAEFDLPAAIGCGERIFNYVLSVDRVYIDCKKGEIIERWKP